MSTKTHHHSRHTHPYRNFVPDCLSLIFPYHIQHISHDLSHYTYSEILFLRKYVTCLHFERHVEVKEFISRFRGPHLQYISARDNRTLDNDTFTCFRGVKSIDIAKNSTFCERNAHDNVTDEDFAMMQLRGIESLDISHRTTIASQHFVHLRGVKHLSIRGMRYIDDSALVHLRGIKSLDMYGCSQITDAGMVNLRGIQSLDITACKKLTEACFENLRGIKSLKMPVCRKITEEMMKNLVGIQELVVHSCDSIGDEHLQYLVGLKVLNASNCKNITHAGLRHLRGIREIDLIHVKLRLDFRRLNLPCYEQAYAALREAEVVSISIPGTNGLLNNLRRVKRICFDGTNISTDSAFVNLANVEVLEFKSCQLNGVTDEGFKHLRKLKRLSFTQTPCDQFTERMVEYISGSLESLKVCKRFRKFSPLRYWAATES